MNHFLRRFTFLAYLVLAIPNLRAQVDPDRKPPADFEKSENGEVGNFPRQREDWFYKQRAYPHATVPAGARLRGYQEVEARVAQELAAAKRRNPTNQAGAWQLLGPAVLNGFWGTNSGRVSALAVDPTNDQIVYLGAAQGGIWKTTDGGNSWTPLTDTQASLAIGSIALDPQNPQTIYVGTGEENNAFDSYYGAGILKSTNGGATWVNIPGPFAGGYGGGARIGGMAVQPQNSMVVLAAVGDGGPGSSGVYRSADSGITWTQTLNVSGSNAYNVRFDSNTPNTVYASIDSNGVYKSVDGGVTWSPANGSGATSLPGPGTGYGRVELALDPNSTKTLWAALANQSTSGLLGLYKTTDGGASWTQNATVPDFCAGQCWYDIAIAVQPGNSKVVVLGGSEYNGQVVVTTDGGSTWKSYNDLHPDTHALNFSADGSLFYTGNDGGIWSTKNLTSGDATWTSLNSGLATLQFYPGMAIDPLNINTMLAGTQDNTTELYSGTTTWQDVTCGDGGAGAIDSTTNPPAFYTVCIGYGLADSVSKSTDGGATWNYTTNGIDTNDQFNWTSPLAMDPSNPQRLYFGTQYVYQSTNGAALWTSITPGLTSIGNVSGITVSPVKSGTVWAVSTTGHVIVTQNALAGTGSSWSDVTGTTMLPQRSLTAVAADPVNAGTAYITFSGFSGYGDNLGHVFMTKNYGSKWTDISGNLPNIPANDIVIDPAQVGTYYVATDFGVFYTTSGGSAWSTLVTGLPRAAVLSLTLDATTRNLRAATHGRSVWGTHVASVTCSVSFGAASADSTAQTLNVAVSAGSGCTWSASNLPSWITSASSGAGPGTLALTLQANSTGADRSAVISVNSQSLTVTQAFTAQTFADVLPSAYYFDAINLLYATHITSGCSSSPLDYCPTVDIPRNQMAVFIVRAVFNGSDNFSYTTKPWFTDVGPNDFGFKWIQKMYDLGITTGCGSQLYCPNETVGRDQMAVFIIRARYGASTPITFPLTPYFTDVPSGYWSFGWIQRMKEDNITSGCTPGTYCPSNPVTRGDMAIFMMRGGFNQLLPGTEPLITSISPNTLAAGATATFTVTGVNTNFLQGTTAITLPLSSGVILNSLTVTSASSMQASLTAAANATAQPISIYVVTGPQEAVLPNGLSVQ